MTEHIDMGILETKISRRGFMKGAGGLTFAFTLGGGLLGRPSETLAAAEQGAKLNAWVTIGAGDTVTIMVPAAERGQGILTALPLILAEELDADWSKVKTEWAPPIPKIYGNPHPLFNGLMLTAASISVAGYPMPLRMAGAQARLVRRCRQVRGRPGRAAEDNRGRAQAAVSVPTGRTPGRQTQGGPVQGE